jgi:hypothetical protein
MNGSTENRASDAAERPGGRDVVLMWGTAQRMLPLVQRIVNDIVSLTGRLARMHPQKERLDRRRRTLAWPDRSQRYRLQEDIEHAEQELRQAIAELEDLGVALLTAHEGQVGFPTVVNDQRAFFSWRPGDDGLLYWHFAEESMRRPIPPSWVRSGDGRLLGKS